MLGLDGLKEVLASLFTLFYAQSIQLSLLIHAVVPNALSTLLLLTDDIKAVLEERARMLHLVHFELPVLDELPIVESLVIDSLHNFCNLLLILQHDGTIYIMSLRVSIVVYDAQAG